MHDGIAQMFHVIEYARMMVGTKAIATLSTGYLNALDYAKTRVQGADLTRLTDKTAPRVTITHHPDVRRMLMLQKAYAEGLRALVLYTATVQDQCERTAPPAHGGSTGRALNDLLLPLVKGVRLGEVLRAARLVAAVLRRLGLPAGLPDRAVHPRRRRSTRCTRARPPSRRSTCFFRKIVRDHGQALGYVVEQIAGFLAEEVGNGRLKEERLLLATALADVAAC